MAVSIVPKSALVVVDSNVLVDLADDVERVWQAIEVIRTRASRYVLVVPPTVIQELALLSQSEEEGPALMEAATKALSSLRKWRIQPVNLVPVGHGICERIADTLIELKLLPSTERNDALVVAETAMLGATILLTSDGHILDIDRDQLHLALRSFDVDLPIRVAPWQMAKLFRR
jgi:predicted nucleic acid-binding protein